jgi:hypothetical protein
VADAERDDVVGVVDFDGFPVVVVVVLLGDSDDVRDLGRVVVVVLVAEDFDVEPDDLVVVVVVDVDPFEADGFVVVVVDAVDGFDVVFVVDFGAVVVEVDGFVVDVVELVAAVGTLGSSLAVDSSRAWVGPEPGVPAGGASAGGGIFSSRSAYCMIRANTGADTWPP